MKVTTLTIDTKSRDALVDITSKVEAVIRDSGVDDGVVLVYVPHTTAGITINENADPDVQRDMIKQLDEMVPWNNGYHHMEGNAAAHVKASMMGSSVMVPIDKGSMTLGTWQGIYFCEFDGARHRRCLVKVMDNALSD